MDDRERRPNQELVHARLRMPSPSGSGLPMSRAELAEAVNGWLWRETSQVFVLDANHIGKYERGENRWPRQHYRNALRAVLGTQTDADLGFYRRRSRFHLPPRSVDDRVPTMPTDSFTTTLRYPPSAAQPAQHVQPSQTGQEAGSQEMRRRGLLTGIAAIGALGWGSPATAEELRHAVVSSVAGDRANLDDWERIVVEYGNAFAFVSPEDLLPDLAIDVDLAHRKLKELHRDADRRAMLRVLALLCALVAAAVSDLGSPQAAGRWWRTATTVADAAADPAVRTWVRARELIHGLYDHRPLPVLLEIADEAVALSPRPGLGSGSAYAARAQILAAMGHPTAAIKALDRLREVFDQLPESITDDRVSAYGWSQVRLHHTESFVHTYLGHTRQAEAAHDQALTLYPYPTSTGCAQVRLHQALALVRSGDIAEGARHAHDVIDQLPVAKRIDMVLAVANHVVQAVPPSERRRAEVAALQQLLADPTPSAAMMRST